MIALPTQTTTCDPSDPTDQFVAYRALGWLMPEMDSFEEAVAEMGADQFCAMWNNPFGDNARSVMLAAARFIESALAQ